jgi:hypothetical protein
VPNFISVSPLKKKWSRMKTLVEIFGNPSKLQQIVYLFCGRKLAIFVSWWYMSLGCLSSDCEKPGFG